MTDETELLKALQSLIQRVRATNAVDLGPADISTLIGDESVARNIYDVLAAAHRGREVVVIQTDDLLTTTEAASLLSVSRRILYRMIKTGEIRAMPLPGSDHKRIPAHEVDRVLRERDEKFWAPLTSEDLPTAEDFADALSASADVGS